jgi:isoquinoline 1-oxidoreductase subunit alpha
MATIALLTQNKSPGDGEVETVMNDSICPCGTYNRARAAIKIPASDAVSMIKLKV